MHFRVISKATATKPVQEILLARVCCLYRIPVLLTRADVDSLWVQFSAARYTSLKRISHLVSMIGISQGTIAFGKVKLLKH